MIQGEVILTDTFRADLYYQARKVTNRNSINENRSMVIRVVEIVPVRVVEIVPVRLLPLAVVEIVPVLVVEIVPALVVEMVPVFAIVVAERAATNNAAQTTELRFFIALLLVILSPGIMGQLEGLPLSPLQADS